VQRICQDEYEIHVQLDKYVLNWELSLPCGKAFLVRNWNKIKALFDDVIASEFRWIDYMDFKSQPMVGLTDQMLRDWVIYCAADAMSVLGMKPELPVPRQTPIPFMDRWIDVSKIQNSPQEEKGRTQYKTNMLRDNLGDRKIVCDF
jgi:ribonucleoside-diphosphate reductase beta chain